MTTRPPIGDRRYRPDIDGLRAIAVMSVVLFHAHFRFTPGGFVGVDVFFVISGFLITNHIVRELRAGTFTFAGFYERRVRRIAPALLVMIALVLAYGLLVLFPRDVVDAGKSAIAAVASVANFYFWATTDYWHGGAKPFLHTWSLSIEEQFYLLVPLLLSLLARWRRPSLGATLWTLCVASFALMVATFQVAPDAAFYLLPQRAWELLIGSLFGVGLVPFPKRRAARELLGAVGVLAIVFVVLRPPVWQAPLPGTLIACVASGVILAAGVDGPTLTGRALAIAPMRWIGLASYSIYLWHEPIVFFAERDTSIVYGRVLGRIAPFLSAAQAVTMERLLLVVAASLVLGFLSWRLVETPFRSGARRPSRRMLFRIAGGSALAVVLGAGALVAADGLPHRFSARVIAIARMPEMDTHFKGDLCIPGTFSTAATRDCVPLAKDRPNWLLLGDSLAYRLNYGLRTIFPQANIVQFTLHGCKPMSDGRFGDSEECRAGFEKLYTEFLPRQRVDLVILAANWQPYDLPRITRVAEMLRRLGQPTAIVGPNMHYDLPMRFLLADAVRQNDPGLPGRHRVTGYDDLDRTMAAMARDQWKTRYFSYRPFCPGGRCVEWAAPDVPFIFDEVHMSDQASVIVAERMRADGFLP